jgi:hypothetical protein
MFSVEVFQIVDNYCLFPEFRVIVNNERSYWLHYRDERTYFTAGCLDDGDKRLAAKRHDTEWNQTSVELFNFEATEEELLTFLGRSTL